jgi:hypothetical protein
MTALPKRIPLQKFLDELPVEASDQVRQAAAQMATNELQSAELRAVEAELKPFFIFAICSFLVGLTILIFYSQPGGFLDRVSGAWPLLVGTLGFLPGLLAYYAIRIRKRSQADIQNFDLNKEIFLPHGVIYFPSDSDIDEQMVTLVEVKEAIGRRSKYNRIKPGAIW